MHAQNAEDEVLLKETAFLEKIPNRTLCVIDIGAFDGKQYSNSLALIERGWNALLIEPSPSAFAKLLVNHGRNPKVTLINAAIGPDTRLLKFWEFKDDLCSTVVEKNAKLWTGVDGRHPYEYWVPQVTMETVITQVGGNADVLSIDTEGNSWQILTTTPVQAWDTSVICIEHDGQAMEIAAWGRERKYRVKELNAENMILVKER